MEGVGTLVRENIEVLSSTQPSEDGKIALPATRPVAGMFGAWGKLDSQWGCVFLFLLQYG